MSNLTSPPEGWCYRLRYTAHNTHTTHTHTHTYVQFYTTVLSTYVLHKYPTHQYFTLLTIIATSIFISSTQIPMPQIRLTLSLTLLYLIIRSFSTQNSYRLRDSSSPTKSSADPFVSFSTCQLFGPFADRRTA